MTIRNEMVEAYQDVDAICVRISEALDVVNGAYIPRWKIQFHADEHSLWYSASQFDEGQITRFERGNLADLVEVCRILNGWDKP